MFNNNNNKKILYLGPSGSYTDIAKDLFAEKYNFASFEEIAKSTITSIIKELDNAADTDILAVVPIENSIEGVVRETLDNLTRVEDCRIKILAEKVLPIAHCLVTKAKSFDEIKVISSYPQGIAQCRNFINNNLPQNVEINTTCSTARAVQNLQNAPANRAAIASEKASKLYNIPVLAKEINDEKDNKTRFVLLGREDTGQTGRDKTSITFSTENKPGALNKILNILEKYSINMSYIDSRPSKRTLGEYTFYIDFDGHYKDEKISQALSEIRNYTNFYRHLGSFEKDIF